MKIEIIDRTWIEQLAASSLAKEVKVPLLADAARLNALAAVKLAGSGHLGSSFSSLDIIVELFHFRMNTVELGFDHPDRDIFFSSKGHDVPGLYAVLYGLGIAPEKLLLRLRRSDGGCGHPDVSLPGIEANSGSLGMGVSKAKGMAWAKRSSGRDGRVYVMTGDGELQEGQNYEAFRAAADLGLANLTVIVDHNKVQSDRPVEQIGRLGDLEAKLKAFGWRVGRCDGHDSIALNAALDNLTQEKDRPQILIADTIKGRGVSFMEHPAALAANNGFYPWHAGAPADEPFTTACQELLDRLDRRRKSSGLAPLQLKNVTPPPKQPSGVSREYTAEAFGEALVDWGRELPNLVILDADLSADCRLRGFETTFPDRFIECGIAEQDMVSTAGGLALQGMLPVVSSFASFLASRANEQIYANWTEGTKVVYVGHYAGLIPAGPGHSHQSIRDISLMNALDGLTIIQPANAAEAKAAAEYCLTKASGSCYVRLNIGPSPRIIDSPSDQPFRPGRGTVLTEGGDAVLIAYGPVMLHEALTAAELLAKNGFNLKVINQPWLNKLDRDWFIAQTAGYNRLFILDDHSPIGGLGDFILSELAALDRPNGPTVTKLGVTGKPVWGTPPEALQAHGLDGASLARTISRP